VDEPKLELILPAELFEALTRIAGTAGYRDAHEAAIIGLAEWTAQKLAELDNRDPSQRYFVNEALDELRSRKK
jgi:hypothetical protein